MQGINLLKYSNVFLGGTCLLPCWLFVSFGISWNFWVCVWDWNKSNRKGRKGKKMVAESYAPMLRVLSSVLLTGYVKLFLEVEMCERERVLEKREYILEIHVMWSAPSTRDKIKCMDVVVSTNHVNLLTNRFWRLISVPSLFLEQAVSGSF